MKQTKTETQIAAMVTNQSAIKKILRSIRKISTVLGPTRQDLNFARWQKLECRDHRITDRFDQVHDRRFK